MARLNAGAAGFNAGTVQSRMLKISDIKVDPEISKVFTVQDKILEEIKSKMERFGFDKSQPVVVWKGKNILLDGHTRLAAAKALGLEEIPVAEKPFETAEDAVMYTFERQVLRRNLTGAEIFAAANMIKSDGRKQKNGQGRAAEQLAGKLGVSPATIYAAQRIKREASEEDKQAILDGTASIRAVHRKLTRSGKPDVDFTVTDAQGLPEHVRFLKGAVVLLAQAREVEAAKLLINHFLKKNEKTGFYKILPGSCQKEALETAVSPKKAVESCITRALDQLKMLSEYTATSTSPVPKTLLKTARAYLEEAKKCLQ
jgi:ParB family chromosome partitioning protein